MNGPPPLRNWFLRLEDGSVFGPVETRTLTAWAREGRVAPTHSISADRLFWIPAPKLDALQMHWEVELTDGSFFGPINLRAVSDLVFDGAVRPTSRLRDLRHGRSSTVRDETERIFSGAIDRLSAVEANLAAAQTELDTARTARAAAEARLAEQVRRNGELDTARRASTTEAESSRAALANAEARLAEETATWQKREAMLERKIEQLQCNGQESAADARALRTRLNEALAAADRKPQAKHPLAALEQQAQEDIKNWMRRR